MGGNRELGVRLKRDASMISKLYSKYTEQHDLGAEGRIRSTACPGTHTCNVAKTV
jgi:hypothetical protein